MDIYCVICGEPWDHDSLHEVAEERYGIPYYLDDDGWAGAYEARGRRRNPAWNSDAYQRVFQEVSREFRERGCEALHSRHSEPSTEIGRFGLTRQEAAAAVYDVLGDDLDAAAVMLDDIA